MIREINAKTHVMNELIDEGIGRVLAHLETKGWGDDTDVFFSTDHGDLNGDYGLIYKGPYHTDSLMRLPLIWRPAPTAGVAAAEVNDPVGQLDLAATFCEIARVPVADWIEGLPLPTADGEPGRERVLCEWDSQQPSIGMHMRSIYRDGWLCTAYEPSTGGQPTGLEKNPLIREDQLERFLTPIDIQYDGTEGELYNVHEDPHQWRNLWADPDYASIRNNRTRPLRLPAKDLQPPRGGRACVMTDSIRRPLARGSERSRLGQFANERQK